MNQLFFLLTEETLLLLLRELCEDDPEVLDDLICGRVALIFGILSGKKDENAFKSAVK